jgi:hypothetical protein
MLDIDAFEPRQVCQALRPEREGIAAYRRWLT